MSEPGRSEQTGGAAPASGQAGAAQGGALPPPRRRRGCLTSFLVLCVFAFGLVCGSGLTLLAVVRRVRIEAARPELRADRAAKFLSRRLDLDAQQAGQVRAVLREQQQDLRREVGPVLRQRLRQTDQEITAVLTPEQQVKWREMVERIKGRWLPLDMREEAPQQR